MILVRERERACSGVAGGAMRDAERLRERAMVGGRGREIDTRLRQCSMADGRVMASK